VSYLRAVARQRLIGPVYQSEVVSPGESASGLLIFVRRSSLPIVALKQKTSRLHQLCRYESLRRINEEALGFRAEREAVFLPFLSAR
jgi:hypothetical protein